MAPSASSNELSGSAPIEALSPDVKTHRPSSRAAVSRDRLVMLSMITVAMALASMLYVQLEFSGAAALLAGVTVLAACLAVHAQLQKAAEITRLKAEIARLEHDRKAHSRAADAGRSASDGMASAPAYASRTSPAHAAPVAAPATAKGSPAGAESAPLAIEPHARWERAQTAAMQSSAPQRMDDAGQLSSARPAKIQNDGARVPDTTALPPAAPSIDAASIDAALWPGTTLISTDSMRDQWAFRPREAAAGPAPGTVHRPDLAPKPSTIDADLATVQRKIKALADEVNAAGTAKQMSMPAEKHRLSHAALSHTALDHSIDALKAAAGTMRDPAREAMRNPLNAPAHERPAVPQALPPAVPAPGATSLGELPIPATAERIAVSEPVRLPAFPAQPVTGQPVTGLAHEFSRDVDDAAFAAVSGPELRAAPQMRPSRLDAITSAIEAGRIEVRLSPIVGLASHEISHYDLAFTLKTQAGDVVDGPEHDLMLAGGDLLALFDTARLVRATALAAKLDARRKGGALLSPVSGPSITNAQFLETFARMYEDREGISSQLVLTFSQADTEQFSASAWQALSDMHAFGFRFALDKVDHLSTDFALLVRRGFTFVKLSSAALLSGMPSRDRFIPADEIWHHLAGAGLTLVAGQIDDEAVRARVLGFGVLLGQGQLFGGARPVSVDVSALTAASRSAAA